MAEVDKFEGEKGQNLKASHTWIILAVRTEKEQKIARSMCLCLVEEESMGPCLGGGGSCPSTGLDVDYLRLFYSRGQLATRL